MVRAYPISDEEIIRRKWLGAYYQQRYYPSLKVSYISETVGWGLITEEDIGSENVIGEYTGLVKKRHFLAARRKDYVGEYTIPGYPVKFIIDAEEYGSLLRFVNHSDMPNVYAITTIYEDILRVYFVAKRPIAKGKQLLIDYGPTYWKWRSNPQKIGS